MTPRRSPTGFTLLELMIVVTILGVLAALAAAAAQRIGKNNSTQNAASDISSVLQNARARAEQRGSDIYVIIYPKMTRTGALTGGNGALFVYEDANGDFLTGGGLCTGAAGQECSWGNFSPPNDIVTQPTSTDRFVQAIYLDDYAKKNVRFGADAGLNFAAPFTSIGNTASTGCSFCANNKGAIVFTGEQQLRFLDDTGAPQAKRVAGLALQGVDNPNNTFLFGLVGATGLVTLVK